MKNDITMQSHHCFDNARVTRLISLGKPKKVILPLFEPLVRFVIKNGLSYDQRNHSEDDLVQIGMIVCSQEVIDKFKVSKGNLFHYACMAVKHAMWSEVKLRPLDKARTQDDVDLDTHPGDNSTSETLEEPQSILEMPADLLASLRLGEDTPESSAKYVFGVFLDDAYEANRARVLTTLVKGYDVNPKHARFVADHVLVSLRKRFSSGVKEVRDDELFNNKFKHTIVPEMREILGERAFERLIHYFGGLTLSIPDQGVIDSIDRDISILKALSLDWTAGTRLSKQFHISPEGIKTVFKSMLHRLHSDKEFRDLISAQFDLSTVPGFELPSATRKMKKPALNLAGRPNIKRRILNTDSMGFVLNCRNSLLYTLIASEQCTRQDLVTIVHQKWGGKLSSAKSTVSAFLSDIRQPFGKFNTSRGLKILTNARGKLCFDKESVVKAQAVIREKRRLASQQ